MSTRKQFPSPTPMPEVARKPPTKANAAAVFGRHLIKKGVECVLMSPSKTERKPGDKIKTDKRDACNIARLFRNGDIVNVRIPPVLGEAVRDVCRARTDAKYARSCSCTERFLPAAFTSPSNVTHTKLISKSRGIGTPVKASPHITPSLFNQRHSRRLRASAFATPFIVRPSSILPAVDSELGDSEVLRKENQDYRRARP